MVVVLLDEEVIVFFSNESLPADEFGLPDLIEQVVVDVGPLLDEAQLGLVAVHHFAVEFALEEEGDEEPVDADEAIVRALVEEQDQRHEDGEGGLEDDVHVLEEQEDQLQVHVLQLDYLRLGYPVPALLRHPQRLRNQLPGQRAFDLDGQLME